jgi:hypothetical protein
MKAVFNSAKTRLDGLLALSTQTLAVEVMFYRCGIVYLPVYVAVPWPRLPGCRRLLALLTRRAARSLLALK